MSVTRAWRNTRSRSGPQQITDADIPELNEVFSEAFTDRYRRDGLAGVRVPHLNPPVWRFAIADAGAGARLWRDDRGRIIAFNVSHKSGAEGWMGPLAVHPDHQGHGVGKSVVTAGLEYLREGGARVIGLETMPRTMDNIGFYSTLGMNPGYLTLTLTVDGAYAAPMTGRLKPLRLGTLSSDELEHKVSECRALTHSILPDYDFSREIHLTEEMALGDTLMLMDGDSVRGFALCHSVPLVDGRVREELRVLKLVVRSEDDFDSLVTMLADHARRSGTRRVAIRMQGQYPAAYRRLMRRGARVRWSDLRMTLDEFSEPVPPAGIVLSNWEI
jgi:GNAT superfamily N-acetyltransferase